MTTNLSIVSFTQIWVISGPLHEQRFRECFSQQKKNMNDFRTKIDIFSASCLEKGAHFFSNSKNISHNHPPWNMKGTPNIRNFKLLPRKPMGANFRIARDLTTGFPWVFLSSPITFNVFMTTRDQYFPNLQH